jgi:hypothetical protein
MKFQLSINIPTLPRPVRYTDSLLVVGSCFTEHIGGRLHAHRFRTLQNPHGILFNPQSVAQSLKGYASGKLYGDDDLFYLNELWESWDHHTRFSHIDKATALEGINASQHEASAFIRQADWIIITLGSAFQYFLKEGDCPVANNHRAPAGWFEKRLLSIDLIINELREAMDAVTGINPKVRFLYTISPVRHVRDGVVDNNRSKARLIEAVQSLCDTQQNCHYFPAYELVIDVLRDYRFYDADLVHPNYAATEAVWEAFRQSCIAPQEWPLMEQVAELVRAKAHRPRFPQTEAHQKFLSSNAQKVAMLLAAHPYLNLAEEAQYFHGSAR